MCGITVYISKNHNDKDLLNVAHRGPDNTTMVESKYFDYDISLVFHRLSIIDIDNGTQPFIFEDEHRKIYLVCNGEIYNYRDLIHTYKLNTKSDCHVILDLYLQKGIFSTVNELDGEFAFVLIDIHKTDGMKVYVCRDRFGIRPLFYHEDKNGIYFSSELKGLDFEGRGKQIEPRNIHLFKEKNSKFIKVSIPYYQIGRLSPNNYCEDQLLYKKIRETLIESVRKRLESEREIGALLSGGLDSSLICAIANDILREEGKTLKTFSIGIEKSSPDIQYARRVAEYIDSEHYEIIIPIETWLATLRFVIKQAETYDITTIRATTGQYLISQWIRNNTNVKVLLVGDGSDEITAGYKYFFNAPSSLDAHDECIRLLTEIHHYDVLRCDRGISAFGIECRVPFLSHHFVDLYLSVEHSLRNPINTDTSERIEKNLLRNSFLSTNLLPLDVLFRNKDAFSDGVSNRKKSLYQYIQEYVEELIDDKGVFPSKEAKFYFQIFQKNYPDYDHSEFKNYWLPKWCGDITEPSARIL